MDTGNTIDVVSDGCTGFQWAEWVWPVHQCCVEHDIGGSDGTLLDCAIDAGVPAVLAAFAVFGMAFWRPIYELILRLRGKK